MVEILGGNVASRRKALIGSYFPPPATLRTRSMHMHTRAFSANSWAELDSRDNAVAPVDPWHKTGSHVHRYTHICISEMGHRSTTPAFLPPSPLFFSFSCRIRENNPCESNSCLGRNSAKGKLVDARGTRQMRGDERS